MVDGLVDTSVVIDIVRGFPDAIQWLSNFEGTLGVTHYVYLEVIQGAKNKAKQKIALKLLKEFDLVAVTIGDVAWAVRQLTSVGLSHNVDALDSLIASTSYRLQIPLYTRNMKHFAPLLSNLAQKPY